MGSNPVAVKTSHVLKCWTFEFNPSISEELLNSSIPFARSITSISDSVINIINHTRKSLHFDKTPGGVKNGTDSLFDVTMRSYDGAKIWELEFTF